jgi:threonine aldolase
MRQAMATAEVGDDVLGEDPSVNRLQTRVAELLGKEAALFVPSGTMGNQIGVRLHCGPGDELICDVGCHIYNYEQGGVAQLSGVATRTVDGVYGVMQLEQLDGLIRTENPHHTRTKLVCLENTHNRGGGRVLPYENVRAICDWAHSHGVATHLDGARLLNAVAATGIPAAHWASHFDSVSICFSKGLGAPVGSAIVGTHEMIERALRHRKLFGGGMRQAGVLAAAALYALDHHVDRLVEDHQLAQRLAEHVRAIEGLELRPAVVDTNLVIFYVNPVLGTAAEFATRLKANGLYMGAYAPRLIRAVTHLDVNAESVERAGEILRQTVAESAGRPLPAKVDGGAYA